MAEETYYSVLELTETASQAEIKAARRRLLREVHPDRVANAPSYWQRQAEERAKEINEAHDVLSNPEKRRQYDRELNAYRAARAAAGGTANVRSSGSQPANAPPQQSHWTAPSAGSSGPSHQSAQGPQPSSASTSTQPSSPASQFSTQAPVPPIPAFVRFLFASILAIFGFSATSAFWGPGSIAWDLWRFLLATILFCAIAYLYRQRLRPLLTALGARTVKQQVYAIVATIAVILLIGRVPRTWAPNDRQITRRFSSTGQRYETQPSAQLIGPEVQTNTISAPAFPKSESDAVDQRVGQLTPVPDARRRPEQQEPKQMQIGSAPVYTPCQILDSLPTSEHRETDEVHERFQAALREFFSADYEGARGKFEDVSARDTELAAAARFYIGEISYRQQDYLGAIKAYDSVLAEHSDSPKAPSAQLKCGLSLLALQRRTEANQVLHSLINSYPQSPEAEQARDQLKDQTVSVTE